jgi:hypothetical protein
MTLPTTASKVTLNGNGVTVLFPYAFLIPGATTTDQDNVLVTLVDTTVDPSVTTVLADNQYSIDGINNTGGGNVTYPLSGSPIAAGVYITIERNCPYVQLTNIPNQSAFFGTVLTAAYDYAMMCIQQLVTLLTYTIKFPATDLVPPVTLPSAADRADTYLGFDGSGAIALYGSPSGGTGFGTLVYRTIFASSVLSVTDNVLFCDATSGSQANTLPAAAAMAGKLMVFKKIDSSANPVTIAGDGDIDGAASFTLAQQNNTVGILSDGTDWWIMFQY